MNEISPITSAGRVANMGSARSASAARGAAPSDLVDQLEISEEAQLLNGLEPTSAGAGSDRLAAIRQQIQDGTYETSDKIDVALERLIGVLTSPHGLD